MNINFQVIIKVVYVFSKDFLLIADLINYTACNNIPCLMVRTLV